MGASCIPQISPQSLAYDGLWLDAVLHGVAVQMHSQAPLDRDNERHGRKMIDAIENVF